MTDTGRLVAAFAVALAGTAIAVPLAIRFARRFGLMDVPSGWKRHARSTPYLGGAGLLCGLLLAAFPLADGLGRFGWIAVGAIALSVLGTIDDKVNLPATVRVAVVAGFAVVLWAQGDGWEIADSQLLGLFFTVVWVVGMVNALNLIDLMDGVASSVALAVAGGISALALVWTDVLLAALAVATCGACIGFLRYNLSRPSRIFLGDGGSMPLGFLFAAMIMVIPWPEEVGASRLFAAALLFGLPIFDMTFRIYSRKRRGDTLMTAGPDSIANWLGRRLPSALAVAITLGLAQSLLSCVAIISAQGGGGTLTIVALGTFVLAAGLIWSLDASGFGRHLNPQDKQHVGRRKASEAVAGAPPD